MATTAAPTAARRAARISTGLGWFSAGLGVPQVLAPGAMDRLIGVDDDARSRFWQRAVGVRELAAAGGILTQRRPVAFLWARAAGDVLDLGLLTTAWLRKRHDPRRLAVATANVAGVLAADLLAAIQMSSHTEARRGAQHMHARTSITIRRPAAEVHERLRQLLQDPEVTRFGPVEILEDEPGRRLGFRSANGAMSKASGAVVYADAPGGRGTEIHLDLEYQALGGPVGTAVQKVTGTEPLQEAKDDLRRLRQVIETGEVVRSDGTPEGHSAQRHLKQRPAQPLEHANA